jgi:hypothetical protein
MEHLYAYGIEPSKVCGSRGANRDDLRLFTEGFDGRPMAAEWQAPEVCLIPGEVERGLLVGDVLALVPTVFMLTARALRALTPVLDGHGELLPVSYIGGELWAFNTLTFFDVMDHERSTGSFLDGGRLVSLRTLAVKEPLPAVWPPIFKLPQWPKGRPIVTRQFMEAVTSNALTGLDLRPLWDVGRLPR